MKRNYLLPHKFKKPGWFILIPSAVFGLFTVITNYEPEFFDLRVFSISGNGGFELFKDESFLTFINDNILNEILGILIIISALMVAFSKEKQEDEYISKIRLESLVWATYVNYAVLLLSFLFLYGFSFLWVMIFNMFTILLFFIVRFNWQIKKLNKSGSYEE